MTFIHTHHTTPSKLKAVVLFMKNIGKFKIKDNSGNVIAYVSEPTAIYNQDCGTLVRIGERDETQDNFKEYKNLLKQSEHPELVQLADNLQIVDIPPLQKAIDKVVEDNGYVRTLHEMIKVAELDKPV